MGPCLLLVHFVLICMRFIAGGWGGWAASRPICEESPMSMGVPPAHRKVWREAPGEGSRVWSEAPMQWSIRSRESTQGCHTLRILWSWPHSVVSIPGLNMRPEALIAFCDQGLATSLQRVDSGSTTRRATVHSLWSGLKIESPKAREGPRVIIFRPWLENRGGSDSTAKVQLQETTRTKPVQQRIARNY